METDSLVPSWIWKYVARTCSQRIGAWVWFGSQLFTSAPVTVPSGSEGGDGGVQSVVNSQTSIIESEPDSDQVLKCMQLASFWERGRLHGQR